ncbi:uncharacterized protein isoform X2 [Musca autumnalis]|uniref:uncharacterized protein isoform X2 n=1 Tax=Musca autumnalis TaxID=221902 RepID=UPI003CE6DCD5
MKALVKLFIYCSIIAVIDLYHNPVMVNANPTNGDLKGQDHPPEEPPLAIRSRREVTPKGGDEPDVPEGFRPRRSVAAEEVPEEPPQEPPQSIRARRDVSPQSSDEPDVPKELRTRRNVSPQSADEPDAPQGLRNRRSANLKHADEQQPPEEEAPQQASIIRAKRQMPSPPDGMPDPPSPPSPPMPSMFD